MTSILISHKYKPLGWIMLSIGILLGFLYILKGDEIYFFDANVIAIVTEPMLNKTQYFSRSIQNNLLDEAASFFIIIGGLIVMVSKEKIEDEFISKMRLEALITAFILNYCILLTSIIFVYDMAFLWVMIFNMFTTLFIFIFKFYWLLYKSNKSLQHA